MGYHVGLDVGQAKDPSALVVVEVRRRDRDGGKGTESEFLVRDLTRLKLGTSYPAVVAYVAGLVGRVNAKIAAETAESSPETPWLVMDATGVGQGVADQLRLALADQRVYMTEAIITSGDPMKLVARPGMRRVSVPKMGLVARLQTLLAWRRIKLPETPMARRLADELQNYEIRPSAGQTDIAGAFRVGSHDDLVVALSLACLEHANENAYRDRGVPWV